MNFYCLIVVLFATICYSTAFFNHATSRTMITRNQLVMRERKCDITGKRQNSKAMSVSKSNRHTHRSQGVNLQTKKFFWTEGNTFVRLRLSTKTIKTILKNGLEQTAKEYGINLKQFTISTGTAPTVVEQPVVA